MYNNKKISIVIPCLNEELSLKRILKNIPDFIDKVIVIDNGSTDNSVEVAKKYNAKVLIEEIRGYGIVLSKGLKHATGDILIIMDGDGSYPIEKLEEICSFMENSGYDFVSGCRFPLTNHMAMPFLNKAANLFISWLIRIFFKIDVRDSQSGLMVFRRSVLDKVSVYNRGMGFSQEIKIKAWMNKELKCAEINITYNKRIGKVKFRKIRDGFKNIHDLFELTRELKHN